MVEHIRKLNIELKKEPDVDKSQLQPCRFQFLMPEVALQTIFINATAIPNIHTDSVSTSRKLQGLEGIMKNGFVQRGVTFFALTFSTGLAIAYPIIDDSGGPYLKSEDVKLVVAQE